MVRVMNSFSDGGWGGGGFNLVSFPDLGTTGGAFSLGASPMPVKLDNLINATTRELAHEKYH